MDEPAYIRTARAAGCPDDQVARFIAGGYVAQPKQALFHAACRAADAADGPRHVGYGGARGPGKSHGMFAQIMLDDCQRFPGLKVLMLRKVGKALKESMADLRLKVLRGVRHRHNRSSGLVEFPNGSRVLLGNFKDDNAFNALIGQEYDEIGIEECTTLEAQKYKLIDTCCRTSKPGWRPRIYSNANPGGIGHAYYHRRFIKGSPDSVFVAATYKDNAFLDPDYVKALESLTGWLRRAWLLGDWNVHIGTYFTNFDDGVHVIPAHDVEKQGYHFHLALDYGFQHPTVALLLAITSLGSVYVVDEYSEAKRLTATHSRSLDAMLGKWKLLRRHVREFTLGQDAWQKGKDGTTVADEYDGEGWHPEPAVMARVQGAQEVLRRLGDVEAGINPSLFVFDNCTGLIEQLPQMQHDPKRPEDVLKVDVDEDGYGGDDYYDALRYGLQAVAVGLGPVRRGSLAFAR